jgi:hypothetical protein
VGDPLAPLVPWLAGDLIRRQLEQEAAGFENWSED